MGDGVAAVHGPNKRNRGAVFKVGIKYCGIHVERIVTVCPSSVFDRIANIRFSILLTASSSPANFVFVATPSQKHLSTAIPHHQLL